MKLHVVHRTTYAYADSVSQSLNEVRLKPVSDERQTCDAFLLRAIPPGRVSHYVDFYFNYVGVLEIQEPHTGLFIESTSEVSTSSRTLPLDAMTAQLTRLPECARMERCYDFLGASAFVAASPEVWRLALDASQDQSDIWQASLAIMRFVHTGFKYDPLATNVTTHMEQVLRDRRGVCQDFTHVMLGMCRAMKIPARYVSGYLYNGPADRLIGAQASHAWCEIYVPELGWRGLDPTNNQQADERYVRVAVGRDYADVAPVKGHYRGTGNKTMQVEVEVREM